MKRFKQPIWTTVALAMLAIQSPVQSWGQSDQMLLLKPTQPAAVQAGANTPPPVKRARLGIALGGAPEQVTTPAQAPTAPVMPQAATQMRLEMLSDLVKVLSVQKQAIALNLCFAGSDTPSESQIMQGSAIVEGLALRAGYVPILVSHSAQLQPGKFNVLIGTVDQIAPILTPQERQSIHTGWVALKNIPGAGPGPVLVVSGKTVDDMENAIISLGLVRELYPVAPSASIRDVVLPAQAPFFRQEPLHYDTTYTFQQLAEAGASLSMPAGGGLAMQLFLPGDFPVNGEGNMSLQLHYQMKTSALSASSAVSVKVNGQVVAQVTGTGEQTAFFGGSGSGTDIPMSAFHAGHNTIELTSNTGSGNGFVGNSAVPSANGGGLQIYSDSTLTVPKSTYVPSLPDLRIACSTFYPFIGQPDGSNLAVLLADRKPETIDATFTLMAKLAQQCNTFLFAAQVGYSQTQMDPSRHLVIVGEMKSLPADFQNSIPVLAFAAGQLNVPLEQLNKAVSGVNLKQVIEQLAVKAGIGTSHKADDEAIMKQATQTFDSFGYLTSKAPVNGKHGWTLLLTAFSPQQLRQQTYNLVQPQVWDNIKGDLARWQNTTDSVQSHVPGEKHVEVATRQFVEMPTGERINLRIWLIAVGVALTVFALITTKLLGKLDQMVYLRQRRL